MPVISLDGGCRLGLGVDSVLQLARGEAIKFNGEDDSGLGGDVKAYFKLITSQTQLLESLDVSVSASVRYGLASADARMDFAEEYAYNDASVYMVLHSVVTNPPRHMVEPTLRPNVAELYLQDQAAFMRAFGDCFIDEVYTGGALTVLYMFHTRDDSTRRDISAELEVQIGGFMAGGEIKGGFSSAVAKASSRSTLEMRVFMSGGRGIQTPTTVDEALNLYKKFPSQVLKGGVPYRVTAKPWEQFPMPAGKGLTFAERVARQDTIESCGRNVLSAIEMRRKAEYIIANPAQYIAPDVATLAHTAETLNTLIKKWANRAGECSDDIKACALDGIPTLPAASWPTRIKSDDPLGAKIDDIRAHDERAAQWFKEEFFPGGPLHEVYNQDPNREGRWRIAYKDGVPVGGVFWTPESGAHVVYGPIFGRYVRLGHCQGRLGYPVTDERFVDWSHWGRWDGGLIAVDPSSRQSWFEGARWDWTRIGGLPNLGIEKGQGLLENICWESKTGIVYHMIFGDPEMTAHVEESLPAQPV